jgi:hypothetical protein
MTAYHPTIQAKLTLAGNGMAPYPWKPFALPTIYLPGMISQLLA